MRLPSAKSVLRRFALFLLLVVGAVAAVVAPAFIDSQRSTEVATASDGLAASANSADAAASEASIEPTAIPTVEPTPIATTAPIGLPVPVEGDIASLSGEPPVLVLPETTPTPRNAEDAVAEDAEVEAADADQSDETELAAESAEPGDEPEAAVRARATTEPEPTATPQPTPEPTATPEPTPEPTATPEPTPEPTATPAPTATPEPTATPAPTSTPAPTATPTPTTEPDTTIVASAWLWVDSDNGLLVRSTPGGGIVQALDNRSKVFAPGEIRQAAGYDWTRIEVPVAGWVALDFLSAQEPVAPVEPTPVPDRVTGDGEPPTAADWAALRHCESSGNYQIVSSNGLYHGAYQFNQQTWNGVAQSLGRTDLVGVAPSAASPADQDALARELYAQRGAQPWPHCGRHLL